MKSSNKRRFSRLTWWWTSINSCALGIPVKLPKWQAIIVNWTATSRWGLYKLRCSRQPTAAYSPEYPVWRNADEMVARTRACAEISPHIPHVKSTWKTKGTLNDGYKHRVRSSYSAEAEPRVPAEKLSMNLTVFCSTGTVVPPDWTQTLSDKVSPEKMQNLPSPIQPWYQILDDPDKTELIFLYCYQ